MKVTDGVLVSIPCNNYFVVGKVLYISQYFKNVILLKVYRKQFSETPKYDETFAIESFELFYTGASLIKKEKWVAIGSEAITSDEKQLNKRVVGGDVWLADDCLGTATDNDLKNLPKMKVFNVNAIPNKVASFG